MSSTPTVTVGSPKLPVTATVSGLPSLVKAAPSKTSLSVKSAIKDVQANASAQQALKIAPSKKVEQTPYAPTPKVVQQRFNFEPNVPPATFSENPSVRGRSRLRERPSSGAGRESSKSPARRGRESSISPARGRDASESPARSRAASKHVDKMISHTKPGMMDAFSHFHAMERSLDALILQSRTKYLRSREEVLSLIMDADQSKLLGKSPSLNDAYSMLFPRTTHVDQSTIEKLEKSMPETPAKVRFEERQKAELSEKVMLKATNLKRMLADCAKDKKPSKDQPYSLIDLKDALVESHPLFKLAWESANEKRPIILVHNPEGQSYYSDEQNMIYIRPQTPEGALNDLFACTLSALYRNVFLEPMDRETYALMKTFVTFQAQQITALHMKPLFSGTPIHEYSFQEHWARNGAAVEQTRRDWDRDLAIRFFSLNPQFPSQRFEAMKKTKADKA